MKNAFKICTLATCSHYKCFTLLWLTMARSEKRCLKCIPGLVRSRTVLLILKSAFIICQKKVFVDFVTALADVPIYYEGNLRDFQVRWLYNCSNALPSGVREYRNSNDGIKPVCKIFSRSLQMEKLQYLDLLWLYCSFTLFASVTKQISCFRYIKLVISYLVCISDFN